MLKKLIFLFLLLQSSFAISQSSLKILSYNIYTLPAIVPSLGREERATMIAELLENSDYDVIVFQEAFNINCRSIIFEKLKKNYLYSAGPGGYDVFSIKTNSGLWILSKHQILSTKFLKFKNHSGVDALARKGALMIEINYLNIKKIQIINTHLQNSGDDLIREKQCYEIAKEFTQQNVPQLLCGDFNIEKKSDMYLKMLKILKAFDGYLEENACTYDRLNNDLKVEEGNVCSMIDYILYRNLNVVKQTRKIVKFEKKWHDDHKDLSDHYAVEAEFILKF